LHILPKKNGKMAILRNFLHIFSNINCTKMFLIQVKTDTLELTIVKGHTGKDNSGMSCDVSTKLDPAPVKNGVKPVCSYINVELCGCVPHEGVSGSQGTILLENPKGNNIKSMEQLKDQVRNQMGCV
jgi:hypothetical protein